MGVKLSIAYCMFHSHLYCGFLPRNRILNQYFYCIYDIYVIFNMFNAWERIGDTCYTPSAYLLGLTYLKGRRLFLTHRSSKHASRVLTAMTATIPVTIAVMSTVLSFSMVPMDAVSTGG